MSPTAGKLTHFRPRTLTLIVLILVAVPTVLANLSNVDKFAFKNEEGRHELPYGWPLIWYWRGLTTLSGGSREWFFSRCGWSRLAGNLAIWLVMLAVAGSTCEWLVRRYRPRLRWSLRTMLAAMGVLAVFCAWGAALRDRANFQDRLIAEIEAEEYGHVYLERWGPQWLDLVGADRFRRRIIGAKLSHDGDDLFRRLARLPDLQYLDLSARPTPGMAAALGEMPRLRNLRINYGRSFPFDPDDDHDSLECMAAIGRLTRLEMLSLEGSIVTSDGLAHLAGLTNLKLLSLHHDNYDMWDPKRGTRLGKPGLLAHLPALPRLEALGVRNASVVDGDLRQLAVLPRLKALDLSDLLVTGAGLAELASLESLEDVTINMESTSPAGLESLLALKRLKTLYIGSYLLWRGHDSMTALALDNGSQAGVRKSEVDDYRRVLEALRRSMPGIVIGDSCGSFEYREDWCGSWVHYPPPVDRTLSDEYPILHE
jgi:hypothetical protein